jgi:putative restriction endonuclease
MVKTFDHSNHPTRAMQVWLILIGQAHHHEPITYEDVGALIGLPAVGLGPILNYIKSFCEKNQLPKLPVLVVRKDTGKPSTGFGNSNVEEQTKAVFNYNWYNIVPPTPEQFVALKSG